MKNPSSYVKAGAGRGAGTILPNTDLSGVLAREGQIMQQGAAKMQKMAQLQQEAKKIEDAKWDGILATTNKVWAERDREAYKISRAEFEKNATNYRNQYGKWHNVPTDKQQEILKQRDALAKLSNASVEQKNKYTPQLNLYLKDPDKYTEKSKENLYNYATGGGNSKNMSLEELINYRTKLIDDNGGLLELKEVRFDWISEFSKSIGKIPLHTEGGVRETSVPQFLNKAEAVYLNDDRIGEGAGKDLDGATELKERFANNPEAMPKEIRGAFKEGDAEWNYSVTVAFNNEYSKNIARPRETSDGGSGYTSADLVYEKADKTVNVKYVYPGALKKKEDDKTYEYQAGDYQNFKVPIQGSIDFGKEIKNVALQAKEVFNPGTGRIEKNIYGNINGKIVGIVKVKGIDDELFVNVESKEAGTLYVPYSELKNKFQNIKFGKQQGYSLADEVERLLLGIATTTTPTTTTKKTKTTTKPSAKQYGFTK